MLASTLLSLAFVSLPAALVDQASPLTGTWTGHMGPTQAGGTAITVQLKSAATAVSGTVTGPQLIPGDITRGSFDPATGALTFDVVVRDAGKTVVSFVGNVARDTAAGRVAFPAQSGYFRITKGTTAAAPKAVSQVPVDPGLEAARRGFVEVSGWVARAAELVPADKYSYRPAPNVRTFGQLVAHVIDGYQYYCARGAGRAAEWTDTVEKGAVDKIAIVQRLKQAGDACTPAYATGGQIAPLMENVGHTSLHYGNMITYMRMLGLTPPSS
jgi:uncharacterized damage-inducible protein DinB